MGTAQRPTRNASLPISHTTPLTVIVGLKSKWKKRNRKGKWPCACNAPSPAAETLFLLGTTDDGSYHSIYHISAFLSGFFRVFTSSIYVSMLPRIPYLFSKISPGW